MQRFEKDVSVVFPAYNEEKNIEACVLVAYCLLREIVRNFEIILVNDGSTDATLNICESLALRFPNVKIISKEKNEGYGFALRDGFKAAKFDLLFFSDADRQFDILTIKDLLIHINTYDIVIGFRKKRQDSFKRRILSGGFNKLVRFLFGFKVTDVDCAFKLFKRHIFNKILIESPRFFVNTEILAKSVVFGFSIKEVGVSHFPRYEGESKVGFSDIPRTLRELVRIYRSIRILQK